MLGAPGLAPSTCVIAAPTVRCSCSEATPGELEYGTTSGARLRVPARSPRTIAASTGRWRPLAAVAAPMLESSPASCAAPASPPLPPLVEASTIVRLVSREANTRASSSSAAVPDSSAIAPGAAASRWARITIGAALVEPGRWATTVLRARSPSIVCAWKWYVRTEKPPPAVPPRASSSPAT